MIGLGHRGHCRLTNGLTTLTCERREEPLWLSWKNDLALSKWDFVLSEREPALSKLAEKTNLKAFSRSTSSYTSESSSTSHVDGVRVSLMRF